MNSRQSLLFGAHAQSEDCSNGIARGVFEFIGALNEHVLGIWLSLAWADMYASSVAHHLGFEGLDQDCGVSLTARCHGAV